MKTSRESGPDSSTHGAEGQASANRDREEKAGNTYDQPKSGPGQDKADKPDPHIISGDDAGRCRTGSETGLGGDSLNDTTSERVSGGDPPKTEAASGDLTDLDAPGIGIQLETGLAEGNPTVQHYPECNVATTSQHPRPTLVRMKRVQSSASSSSEGELHW